MLGGARPKFAYPPQLIVVDGGAPQVSAAYRALQELGLEQIPLVGLAKRLEEVWMPNNKDPIILPRHSEGLYLLQRVRDEAHRFAITGMRAKRAKVRIGASKIEDIPGIGPKKRAKLLQRFGGVRGVAEASAQDLMSVEGISPELAQAIYLALR